MQSRKDVTKLPDLGTTRGRVTPQRTRRPVYVDLLPPCNAGCPAGENIQNWLYLIKRGRAQDAWRQLTDDNPFPAIHGRVCYHPCEVACNRAELDQSVSIHAVERYLGDLAIENGWTYDKPSHHTGKKVLVIGAGPSGLSAAYHLARLGHEVEIRDGSDRPGGMMRWGIPEYRLPRDVLDAEIDRLVDLGVTITCNHPVHDLAAEVAEGGFDACFIAIGAHLSKKVDIPAQDTSKLVDAVGFLRDVAGGGRPLIGRKVAVYGGGNTAMDAARTAVRLGADETTIIYRRTREQMPAHQDEAEAAEQEGVKINWLQTITEVGDDLTVEIMELDEDGRPRGTGRFERLDADTVIMAVGQKPDTGFLHNIHGLRFDDDTLQVDPRTLMSDVPGIFAGGDAVPSERTVTVGTGHGKKAAHNIHMYLSAGQVVEPTKHPMAGFDKLNLWYFRDSDSQRTQPEMDPETRLSAFEEIVGGLSPDQALFEAQRCLSCGNCFECDGCLGACPEDAVIKLGKGHRYRFDYDKCTGCATCFEQCPVHAIEMVPEGVALPPDLTSAAQSHEASTRNGI
ncbi:NADPH-dependent glutamate synthase beta chain [Raineyella antarctica]|uniref:NADPH-dependent glutamate synthase beta chain n=1 Tax=Raineyella antarctica TaxID=1577474 RepID=A0A1G6H8L0_9ACTN|nr:NAD(P)-binding protein [Raineyella antarctica]SDB90285.1 NADPH-dependent glutamate synthase beta chain [Raineyella antarctica]